MPPLPRARTGEPLRVSRAPIEFSYFPTTPTTRRAKLQTKAYTTDPWAAVHSSVRQIRNRAGRASAIPFAEQANEFYVAAMSHSTTRAKPLLLYYAFLNLAKTICLCRGNHAVVGDAKHGLSERPGRGGGLKSATVEAFPSSSSAVNMFDEFMSSVVGTHLKASITYRVHDLMACSLIGHRLWCDATGRGDCFLRLDPIELMHDEQSKNIWLRAWLANGSRERSGVSGREIGIKGFDRGWRQVDAGAGHSRDRLCWEMATTVSYTGRPSDVLGVLASNARATFYRSLTTSEPFRNYYIYVAPKKFMKHHQMASRYVLLYFLGSISRYRPAEFDQHMSGEYGPFLSEFLASEPSQMLFELASLLSGRELVSAGLA